jgi:hypothetical protein
MDLYYFMTWCLGKTRLSRNPDKAKNLHYQMCLTVMKDGLKEGIEIPRDHFKDLALDTKIPTPQGFTTIEKVKVGDIVYASNGMQTEVAGVSEIFEANKCYEITFSTGEKVVAGADHQWIVDNLKSSRNNGYTVEQVRSTERLLQDYQSVRFKNGKQTVEHNYKVRLAGAIQNTAIEFPIHPYVLGAWLGDGKSYSGGLSSENREIPDIIESFGYAVKKLGGSFEYAISGNNFTDFLRGFRLIGNKYLFSTLLRGSIEERLLLLQGLMDTDGSASVRGSCSFANCDEQLVIATHELAASLGYKVGSIGNYKTHCPGYEKETSYYSFSFYATRAQSPFLLPRKTARLKETLKIVNARHIVNICEVPSVRTKCISVVSPDKSFLITESFIPTHNSTVYTEGFPIWRALPFGHREEDFFTSIGYSDLYITWMHRCHNQDIRILLVSETITNSVKLGVKVAGHYENTEHFRKLFPEIMPTAKETWTKDSLHQHRTPAGRSHGEGTYDFIGVGAALQSRHYDVVVEDDLVGREARKSSIVMADTIDYHQVLVGATDRNPDNPGRDFDEIVVGNRWSHDDLNSHIRAEEPYFNWTTHSALGGCCSLHPFGNVIFPEEWSKELLLKWKRRLGSYHFSCQFLNFPIDPSKVKINLSDFRYFHLDRINNAISIPKELPAHKARLFEVAPVAQFRSVLRHHVADGDVEPDVYVLSPSYDRYMVIDPNHGGSHMGQDVGKDGRCRHALAVTGVSRNPRRVHVLDEWAEACGPKQFVERIFFYAIKWKLRKVYVEAVAAQKYLLYHLNVFVEDHKHDRPELAGITFLPLKTPNNAGAKQERIENFIPMIEAHEIWLNANNCTKIKEEAEMYGQRKGLIDLLDVLSYGPQVWKFDVVSQEKVDGFMQKQRAQFIRRMTAATS